MAGKEPKKLAIIYILKVLEKHSDHAHRFSQQQLIGLVQEEYGMLLDRKTIKHNLSKLLEAGFPLEYEERTRTNVRGDKEIILTNWYYRHEHKWDDSELQVMIDSLLFSNYLPPKQCRDLVKKIAELGDGDTRKRLAGTYNTVHQRPVNRSLFYTIYILSEAIFDKKQVGFRYSDYDTDFKLHPRLNDDDTERRYTISPYKLVSLNGRYYLLGSCAEHEGISHFRVDRITDIDILKTAARSVRSVKGYENGIDLGVYISEHPNMWGGEVSKCTFRCRRYMMNDIVDWFGSSANIRVIENDMIEVRVRVSEDSMYHWAVQYADCVEVLSPGSLRAKVADTLLEAAERYK
ncbi:MAG: WYL domain-containing protein [Ruminococcus sp.]|nr:WYL domain-containing protein [Ruminococcus sp.]